MFKTPDLTHAWIRLQDLRIDEASVGALPHEKTERQQVRIDAAVYAPIAKPANSDALRDTLDYTRVAQLIRRVTLARHFELIESLAETLAQSILQEFSLAGRVHLEVHKPGALDNGAVSIIVERWR